MAEQGAAHHFHDLQQQREAVTLGMWAFLVTEVMLFGGLFTGYAVYRVLYTETFHEASHHLKFWMGTVNTVILLTSSLTMVLAVQASAHQVAPARNRRASFWLVVTALLGLGFLVVKAFEYSAEIHEGFLPGPNFHWAGEHPDRAALFFAFYWVMTGLHAFHMLVGLALVGGAALLLWRGKLPGPVCNKVEMTGLYWHLIDAIWIFLYPLLYLIERG